MKNYLVVLLAIFCNSVSGQNSCCVAEYKMTKVFDTVTTVIEGTVKDMNTNMGIEGVTISLSRNGETVYAVSSGKKGEFVFFHIQTGIYDLMVEKNEYCKIYQDNLSFGGGIEMQICLMHSQ